MLTNLNNLIAFAESIGWHYGTCSGQRGTGELFTVHKFSDKPLTGQYAEIAENAAGLFFHTCDESPCVRLWNYIDGCYWFVYESVTWEDVRLYMTDSASHITKWGTTGQGDY